MCRAAARHWLHVATLLLVRAGLVAAWTELSGDDTRYLIASFPQLQQVNYARLPDQTWRPLLATGLKSPGAICLDATNSRLFVADPAVATVYWYQYEVTSDKNMATDGVQRVAMSNIAAKSCTTDVMGNLYVSGRNVVKAPEVPAEAIYKQDAVVLATGTSEDAVPARLWTHGTGSWVPAPKGSGGFTDGTPLSPSSPEVFQPSAVAVDPVFVYWGNAVKSPQSSALLRGALNIPTPLASSMPLPKPKIAPNPLSNNVDGVTSMVLTPAGIYYAARQGKKGGVYGVPRGEVATAGCLANGTRCPLVASVAAPTGLAFDGDSTVYVADRGFGAVWSFAAGIVAPHLLDHVADAHGVQDIAVLVASASRARLVVALAALLPLATAVFCSSHL